MVTAQEIKFCRLLQPMPLFLHVILWYNMTRRKVSQECSSSIVGCVFGLPMPAFSQCLSVECLSHSRQHESGELNSVDKSHTTLQSSKVQLANSVHGPKLMHIRQLAHMLCFLDLVWKASNSLSAVLVPAVPFPASPQPAVPFPAIPFQQAGPASCTCQDLLLSPQGCSNH